MNSLIEIAALDHVHIYVADPDAAADWYGRILGLQVLPSSKRLQGGKYMATPRGQYCATIFQGKPPSDGDHTTAFRVTGRVFMEFGDALPHEGVMGRDGQRLRSEHADDHELAFSYYFQDPDGNHLEITTYDHEPVRRWFKNKKRTHTL
ncbi:MAG: VOC family protein [Paracoccaceae bacterium]|nr:VOC family protein [Paracoccaceae bacterium]